MGREGTGLLGLTIGLVAATAIAASAATIELVEVPSRERGEPDRVFVPEPELPAQLPDRVPGGGFEHPAVAAAIACLLAAVVLAWLIRRRLGWWGRDRQWFRLRRIPAPAPAPVEEVLAAVAQAAAMLDDAGDHDPRRAVIGCWVRLTEAASTAGVPSHASDTATDLVLRLLRRHRVSEPVLAELATAYLLARYATHPVDDEMSATARSALRRLHTELLGEMGADAGRGAGGLADAGKGGTRFAGRGGAGEPPGSRAEAPR